MRLLQDEDIRHYLKITLIGFLLFGVVVCLFLFMFRSTYEIHLVKDTLEYGEEVRVVDLVDGIGSETFTEDSKISSNTIRLSDFEVTFSEIDFDKLGEQTITATFSDESIKDESFVLHIVDTTAPVITIKEDPVSMDLEQVKEKDFESLFEVTDNYTSASKIKLKMYIEEENYTYEDQVTLVIQATDSNKNRATKHMTIQINPKPEEPEEKEEAEPSQESGNSATSNNSSSYGTNQPQSIPSQSQNQQSTAPAQPQKPSNRQFLFSDGYTMDTVSGACSSALFSSGYAGSCVPLQDANGIYYGMELRFY